MCRQLFAKGLLPTDHLCRGGWHTRLNVLMDVLEGSQPRPFYKMQLLYEAEYGKRLGLG